ncbi:MAG: dTDP-4-dehydrorhamnose reductase [Verrucomicrobia bacterium]|nr:dTDP-4-dehydrorhamnose reductase [Verrucomicrobiota bacterium]
MESPKILLIGKNGQVGWELRRTLAPVGRVLAVDYPEIDLTDAAAARRLVRDNKPNVVVNAAAYTAVDKAESEIKTAQLINGVAPGVLAEAAKQVGALLIHYSTDYVFDGTKTTPYVETDAPNPLGAYGRTKLEGDEAIRATGGNHLIFRLCWVYGARGQNFLLTMQRLARERETLRIVKDQFGCPTWSRLIAEATTLALRQVLAASDANIFKGTYHLAAGGSTNWHTFASRIVGFVPEAERRCREVAAITTAEYPTPAKRPAYSVLDCGKLKKTFGIQLPQWEDGLRLVLGAES